jgi:hypothetical protein
LVVNWWPKRREVAPSDTVIDRLDRRLDELRARPGLPSPPGIDAVKPGLQETVEVMPPSAVDPYTGRIFDHYIASAVDAEFEAWHQAVQRSHDEVLGALDGLSASVAEQATKIDKDAEFYQAQVENLEETLQGIVDDALDPEPAVFAIAANPTTAGGGATTTKTVDLVSASHRSPDLLVRRHWTGVLYLVVLLVAASIDIATFYQVFALVVFNVPDWVVWLGVVGFTTTALSLAHAIGVQARGRVMAHRMALTSPGAWLCLAIWFFVGGTAFVVRGVAPVVSGGNQSEIVVEGQTESASAGPPSWLPALLFLALYLATGAVAAVGAYRRHNPAARAYRTTADDLRSANERVVALTGDATRAKGLASAVQAEAQRRNGALAAALHAEQALKGTLKEWAQLRLVALKGDATYTQAQAPGTN